MSQSPKRVVVFGGSGFIGNSVATRLRRAGHDVVTVSRNPVDDEGAQHQVADLLDPTTYSSLLDGANAVICLASATLPNSDVGMCVTEVHEHVGATVDLIQRSATANVDDFIFGSSAGTVYGDLASTARANSETDRTRPRNMYGVSKLAIEGYLRVICAESAMVGTSLRISNPYGATQSSARGQGFIAAALKACIDGTVLTVWGDGSATRDFVHIDDVAAAFEATLAARPAATELNIGSGTSTSLRDIISLISQLANRELTVRFDEGRHVDVQVVSLDVSLAETALAWQAAISLEQGLAGLLLA